MQLNLLPANKTAHGYQRGNNFGIQTIPGMPNQSFASWGGQAVYEAGMYHLVFADFETCGLGCWGGASQLARAVSQHPLGPYKKVEVIAPPFHHNPTLNKVPGGPFVITSIGCAPIGGNGSVTNCSSWLPPGHWPPPTPVPEADTLRRGRGDVGVADPAAAGVITMLYSDKITGPWKQHPGVILEPSSLDKWDSFVTNPSLYFFDKCVSNMPIVKISGQPVRPVCMITCDCVYARVCLCFTHCSGSALLAYRGGPCGLNWPNSTKGHPIPETWCNKHQVAVATSPSWDQPFKRVGTAPAWTNQTEDP